MAFIRKKQTAKNIPTVSQRDDRGSVRAYSASELRSLAKKRGIETNPLDVHSLALALGIRFICTPMDDEISGALTLQEGSGNWLMKVNALHHPNRQRFTIAHELAHYCLHASSTREEFIDTNFFRNGDMNPMESEANRFAGELLMPEQEFRAYASTFSGNIEALAQHFKVSTLAVRVRAKTLGMKGHGL